MGIAMGVARQRRVLVGVLVLGLFVHCDTSRHGKGAARMMHDARQPDALRCGRAEGAGGHACGGYLVGGRGGFALSAAGEQEQVDGSMLHPRFGWGPGPMRLKGGHGHRKEHIADKIYKKRKKALDKELGIDQKTQDAEGEIAEEVRGLPLRDRLAIGLEGKDLDEVREARERTMDGLVVPHGEEYAKREKSLGEQSSGNLAPGEGTAGGTLIVKRGLDQQDVSDDSADEGEEQGWNKDGQLEYHSKGGNLNFGRPAALAGQQKLRTQPCTGDAWAGIFFDLEAKTSDILVKSLCFASANFRLEETVNVKIWTSQGSSQGIEGDKTQWELIFISPNCTLPKVKRLEAHAEGENPYAQFPFDEQIRIPAGQTISFAIYTNSLCGVAIRCNSASSPPKSPEDKDMKGNKIGEDATVPIVKSAQDARRWEKNPIVLGEVTDSDEHVIIKAGYCSPVTGKDHPFDDELIEREGNNVFAFVGEIVYDVEG